MDGMRAGRTARIAAAERAATNTSNGPDAPPPPPPPVPPRIAAGIELDPRLPDPVAGVGYAPSVRTSGTPNQRSGALNGYRAELQHANVVAALPGETVVRYGDNVFTAGADVISVNVNGTVSLWDTKYLSAGRLTRPTSTFAVRADGSYTPALANAVEQARRAILSSNLPIDLQNRAIDNLDLGNFNAHTPGAGAARSSAITRFCNRGICGN
jgi:filamentous hemagglutinin